MSVFDAALRTILDKFVALATYLYGVPLPWGYAVANGEISGAAPLVVIGYDGNTDTVTGLPVWPPSTAYTWQIADQQPRVASNSANDDGAPLGSGAQVLRVWWLDAAGVETVEDVTLNGVAQVLLAGITARRVNRMAVVQAGATGWNEGTITCYASDGVTIMCQMSVARGVSDSAIQTVPAGKRDFIHRWFCNGTTGLVRWYIGYRETPTSPWKLVGGRFGNVGSFEAVLDAPLVFAAGTDYYVWGFASGANCVSTVNLQGWREDA